MWRALALVVTMAGCGRLFDLEPPVLDPTGDGGRHPDGDVMHADGGGDGGGDGNTATGCPASYNVVLGVTTTRYRVVTNQAIPWDMAQSRCLSDQVMGSTRYTHLVVGASDIELSALDSALANEIWVGLSDRAIEGAYQWVTQENNNYPPASGDPWGANEPVADTMKDCVSMNATGDLQVVLCGNGKNYVCECDAFMNDPTKY